MTFGRFDVATIHAILDAQPLCTVAYVRDGKPYLTPTLQWRERDRVFWHGSSASHALRALASDVAAGGEGDNDPLAAYHRRQSQDPVWPARGRSQRLRSAKLGRSLAGI